MRSGYLEIVALTERLHRQFLDMIQLELENRGIHDINNVQARILHNIGETEMAVGELMGRGCYLGSSVSYNLKKLTEAGYIKQRRSPHDRRVTMVSVSEKGQALCVSLREMNDRHLAALSQGDLDETDIAACNQTLRGLQKLWDRFAASST